MTSITDRSLWCTYGPVRLSFKEENEDEEFLRRIQMENAFDRNAKNPGIPRPVATFASKLLDITEIWVSNQPNYLENLQGPVNCFHKNLEKLKKPK